MLNYFLAWTQSEKLTDEKKLDFIHKEEKEYSL